MQRREFLKSWALLSAGATVTMACASSASGLPLTIAGDVTQPVMDPLPKPVLDQPITVAFLLSEGAEVVDFAGPWGVFEYTYPDEWSVAPFNMYIVAEKSGVLTVSGGMKVVSDHTFETAPQPRVIVIPAQSDPTPAMLEWLKKAASGADMTMSVCAGAFLLAETGLLDGKEATTHHSSLALFAADYPKINARRGARFTDSGNIATSGGLTSGIDLAVHVVERYFGRDEAEAAVKRLEYQGRGWKEPSNNIEMAARPNLTGDPPHCAVCEWKIPDKQNRPSVVYQGKTYYFCSDWCNERFNKSPEYFAQA